MSLNLWLIRHGESEINQGNWSSDPTTTGLTSLGKEQAKAAASQIVASPDLIITSPLKRAQDSAQFIIEEWPQLPRQIWPIQELMYLSPSKLLHLSPEERKRCIDEYWYHANPEYQDGEDAETFTSFLNRVEYFYKQLSTLQGFVIAVGHGQFFKAFQLGLKHGYIASNQWMQMFRQQVVEDPIKNGEIIQLQHFATIKGATIEGGI